jgi:uncharacterized protein (TIGR02271 family)
VQTNYSSQVHEGMDVLDRDGDKIGKCGETLGQYFNVDAGFLGTKEYYVPFSAITEVQDDAIFLNADKDELESLGWDRQPDDWGTASTTMTTARQGMTETTARAGMTETEGGQRMQLREEELQARKTSQETGRVSLGKEVVEEQRTMDVPVQREEVYVERHPVDRQPADRPIDETADERISVPVRQEQVEVSKRPVVYEEVGVGKRQLTETQQVSDTVRREELRTDDTGDAEVRTDPNR